jgi:hypothetical protein
MGSRNNQRYGDSTRTYVNRNPVMDSSQYTAGFAVFGSDGWEGGPEKMRGIGWVSVLRAPSRLSRRKAIEEDRFRPTYAGANVGHPYRVVGTAAGLRGRPAVSHPSQKTRRMGHPSIGGRDREEAELWGPQLALIDCAAYLVADVGAPDPEDDVAGNVGSVIGNAFQSPGDDDCI